MSIANEGRCLRRPVTSSLAAVFRDRDNGLNLVRLVFAIMVLVSHSFVLGFGRREPHIGGYTLGGMAVNGFFLLSGFLIARSWRRAPSAPRYAWHRFLRIVPGLWVCLLVTAFFIGPLIAVSETRSIGGYFHMSTAGPWTYWPKNAFLALRQTHIGGLLSNVPYPNTMNGSLWTLLWEAECYVLVALLGVVGLLSRKGAALSAIVVWIAYVADAFRPNLFPMSHSVYGIGAGGGLVLAFLIGCCVEQFSDVIPMKTQLAFVAAIITVFGWSLPGNSALIAEPMTAFASIYVYLWVGIHARRIRLAKQTDISYGIYIYAFPIQQLFATTRVASAGIFVYILCAGAATSLLALGSWRVVESRALRLKGARSGRVQQVHATVKEPVRRSVGTPAAEEA